MSLKNKITALQKAKGKRPLAALTAYDYPTGRILDDAGTDLILVGDSLGMVVLGFPNTTHVTLDMMVHHTAAVARGVRNAIIIGDLPIHSYDTPEQAVESATPIPASIPLWSVLAALTMALLTGMLFGLLPAMRASRLDPVEALRAE